MSNDFAYKLIPPGDGPLVIAYGMGVDSTAMLVLLWRNGLVPDVICFADTGGEKPETMAYIDVINGWLLKVGFPQINVVKKQTLESTPYDDLYGNCFDNETLPSLAFGMKSCSIKWKHQPQDKFLIGCKSGPSKRDPHPVWIDAQARGLKPIKLIGYDASPADMRRTKKAPIEDEVFQYWYPLAEMGIKRNDCVQLIVEAGLPVPVKSACFFCPASKKWELYWLAATHPELFESALKMEYKAMVGRHTRFDKMEFGADWEQMIGSGDRWPSTKTTVGLGRTFAWNHWARMQGIVNNDGLVVADKAWLIEMAEKQRHKESGNANDIRFQSDEEQMCFEFPKYIEATE